MEKVLRQASKELFEKEDNTIFSLFYWSCILMDEILSVRLFGNLFASLETEYKYIQMYELCKGVCQEHNHDYSTTKTSLWN